MKKNIMKVTLVAAVAAMAGYGVYAHQTKEMMSDVMLENVEALATDENIEGGGITLICYTTFTPADWFHEDQYFINCDNCMRDKGRDLRDRSECNR